MNEKRIILASGSPRRRELLAVVAGDNFEILPAQGEEKKDTSVPPDQMVMNLAEAKAAEIAQKNSDAIVIGADTIVVSPDGEIMGKPKDADDARRMLVSLSGKTHRVFTGVCIICGNHKEKEAECTEVTFRTMESAEIEKYIATGEPMDKAGAYGIQGKAAPYISGISGDYYNVVGLPLCTLGCMLKKFIQP